MATISYTIVQIGGNQNASTDSHADVNIQYDDFTAKLGNVTDPIKAALLQFDY